MKVKINKILLIVVLAWLVSASYSYYVLSLSPSLNAGYVPNSDESFFSLIFDRIIPGRPSLKAKSAIVVDAVTGEALYSKNEDLQLPIASLTKLAAAMVFLKANPDLNRSIIITGDDLAEAGRTRLYKGISITLNDCLHLSLMRSDNAATRALVRSAGLSDAEFAAKMNELAAELGMKKTHFVDPTGRYADNVSTAADFVKLVKAVYANEIIAKISSKKMYLFKPLNNNISYTLYNTNRLLYGRWSVKGGKTGYISQAGYCLALDVFDESGKRVYAVVLGSPSNNYRYRDANRLIAYAMKD